MEKHLLMATAVKKKDKKDKVTTIKMSQSLYEKLKRNDVDIAKTINNWLEMYAENLPKK